MKEKYETPEMEIVTFEAEDVIRTSDMGNQDDLYETPDDEFGE